MSLETIMEGKSDAELLKIINEDSNDYTKEALEVAGREIEKRKLSEKILNDTQDKVDNTKVVEKIHIIAQNSVASVLKVIGIIEIILGVIACLIIIIAQKEVYAGIVVIISGFIGGFMFIGFGEIINLLHQINEKENFKL